MSHRSQKVMYWVMLGFFVVLGTYLFMAEQGMMTGLATAPPEEERPSLEPFEDPAPEAPTQDEEGPTLSPAPTEEEEVVAKEYEDFLDSGSKPPSTTRISEDEKGALLARYGVDLSEEDQAAVYLAPVVVNAKSLEVSDFCQENKALFYDATTSVRSACFYSDARSILTDDAATMVTRPQREVLYVKRADAPEQAAECPDYFRERTACQAASVDVVSARTPQLAPDGTFIEVVESQLLQENAELAALISTFYEDGRLVRTDIVFENAA